jgi:hypothetical protein
MTPGHLKAAAIAFALLSLVLLAVAPGQWSSNRVEPEAAPRPRRWLRNSIGDAPTVLLYLGLSGVMVWVGRYTDWTFGRH